MNEGGMDNLGNVPRKEEQREYMTMPDGSSMDVTNMSPEQRREEYEAYNEN